MIPKIIHYCWFGKNEKSPIVKKCIESWKKYCPDYEIIEWNENNFDVDSVLFTKQAYAAGKWAFVADYVRLYALSLYGGIYLDTDMELFRDLSLLENDSGILGFESNDYVAMGIIGVEKNSPFIKVQKSEYEDIEFLNKDGSFNMLTNVHRVKSYLTDKGLKENGRKQKVGEFTVYPVKYFYPNSFGMVFNKYPKDRLFVHHAEGSWRNQSTQKTFVNRLRRWAVGRARDIIGTDRLEAIRDRNKNKQA